MKEMLILKALMVGVDSFMDIGALSVPGEMDKKIRLPEPLLIE